MSLSAASRKLSATSMLGAGATAARERAGSSTDYVGLALQGKGDMRTDREIELLLVFVNQDPILRQLGAAVRRRLCELASSTLFDQGQVIVEAGQVAMPSEVAAMRENSPL